jgi:hypothetical protein
MQVDEEDCSILMLAFRAAKVLAQNNKNLQIAN